MVALATSLLAFAFVVRDIFHEQLSNEHVARDPASTSNWFLAKGPDHLVRTPSLAEKRITRTQSLVEERIARTQSLAKEHVTRTTASAVENISAAETSNSTVLRLPVAGGAAEPQGILLEHVNWRKRAESLREQAIHWQRVAGELSCQLEGPDGTSPSGG